MAFRAKMDIANRAKIFAPFAALKGFEEAIYAKEKVVVPKRELTEESIEELDRKLQMISCNDMITVVYYCMGEYLQLTDMVSKIDVTAKLLRIVDTKIRFEDILEICVDEEG